MNLIVSVLYLDVLVELAHLVALVELRQPLFRDVLRLGYVHVVAYEHVRELHGRLRRVYEPPVPRRVYVRQVAYVVEVGVRYEYALYILQGGVLYHGVLLHRTELYPRIKKYLCLFRAYHEAASSHLLRTTKKSNFQSINYNYYSFPNPRRTQTLLGILLLYHSNVLEIYLLRTRLLALPRLLLLLLLLLVLPAAYPERLPEPDVHRI